jgi:ankyrin repeat protein
MNDNRKMVTKRPLIILLFLLIVLMVAFPLTLFSSEPAKIIQFRQGAKETTVEGTVEVAKPHRYLLRASKGQEMEVRLFVKKNPIALEHAISIEMKAPREDKGRNAKQAFIAHEIDHIFSWRGPDFTWDGFLPESGDYSIVISSIGKQATYELKIRIDWKNRLTGELNGEQLLLAARYGRLDLVSHLIEQGIDVNFSDAQGDTPLHKAAMENRIAVVKFLITKGADVNRRNRPSIKSYEFENGDTPLHYAVRSGAYDVAEFLIANGAGVNADGWLNGPPLNEAAAAGPRRFYSRNFMYCNPITVAKLLLDKGANLGNSNPLFIAAIDASKDMLEFLIAKGAKVNAKNDGGRTPLFGAALEGPKDIIDFLVNSGATVNWKDESEITPLHIAAEGGKNEIIELLIMRGADIEAEDRNGSTPLKEAVRYGNKNAVELIISKGADVNATSRWGQTPLHTAAFHGQTEIAELLIAKGANVNAKDANGKTPLKWAHESSGNPGFVRKTKEQILETAAVIKKHGGIE